MAGIDIAKKVAKGLSKARAKTGAVGVGLVELRKVTVGRGTPINPTQQVVTWLELKDCLFKTLNKNLIDGELVKAGDISGVANGDIEVKLNSLIRRDGVEYIIKTVTPSSPTGVTIAYEFTARVQ